MGDYAIVVHGGAGSWLTGDTGLVLAALRTAAEAGIAVLSAGGSATDAVVEAVSRLEDEPLFNAGTGSVLNLDGEVEMDAGVMSGESLQSGNVAALRGVRNPILVARKVMELTDHVLVAGEGALRFARALGVPDYDPVTTRRRDEWRERRARIERCEGDARLAALHQILSEMPVQGSDTVGAVALDRAGRLAAATSTGGMPLKLPGRIGDSPLPGAGNYASPHAAVSATGRGELMMRTLAAKAVADAVARGRPVRKAVQQVLRAMAKGVGREAGIIALDARGRAAAGHLTPAMPHAVGGSRHARIEAAMRYGA